MDTTNGANKFLMPGAVLVGLIFIGGAVLWNGKNPATLPAGEGAGLTEAKIQAITKSVSGIDEKKVTAAVKEDGARYKALVTADRTEGGTVGINATPSFVVGIQRISGAHPYPTFQAAIDATLSGSKTVVTGAEGGVDIKNVKTEGSPFIGKADAPVVIAQWFDYQCSYCKKFAAETLPAIIEGYVNAGKVKVVFKDFQFLSPMSEMAALYGRAVWELYPEQYLAWHEAMMK